MMRGPGTQKKILLYSTVLIFEWKTIIVYFMVAYIWAFNVVSIFNENLPIVTGTVTVHTENVRLLSLDMECFLKED